ncbi:MAG: DUF6362 family protein [Pseudomonadota bacterium]
MLPDNDDPIDNITFYPPNSPSHLREEGRFYSFEDVQERLVEAMLCAWRLPDREAGWQRVKAMWPDVWRHTHFGDYGESASEAVLRPAASTRAEIAEMEEAFDWLSVVKAADRKLVGLAITALARGEKRVPWRRLLKPMGLQRGADGLRMRYGRALQQVCGRANGGNPSGGARQTE